MPKEWKDLKESVKDSHPDWSEDKVAEVASKIFYKTFGVTSVQAEGLLKEGKWESYKQSKSSKKESESSNSEKFEQFTTGVEFKEEDGNYYVEGFVSAPDVDLGFDVVENQHEIIEQLESGNSLATKLSYRHDWFKKDGDKDKFIPIGKYVKGSGIVKQHPLLDKEAAWARFKMNKRHPDFEMIKEDIKEGYVDGFSIEFKAINFVTRVIGNVAARVIKSLKLVGIGLAMRPMNPNAIMTGFVMKEFEYLGDINENSPQNCEEKEVDEMDDVNKQTPEKKEIEEKQTPEKKENETSTVDLKPEIEAIKAEMKELAEFKELVKTFSAEFKEFRDAKKVLVVDAGQTEGKESKEVKAEYKEYFSNPTKDNFVKALAKTGVF